MRNRFFYLLIFMGLLCGSGAGLIAQTGITGNAAVSLVDTGLTCNGMARQVEVHIDLTDLVGTASEPAGLNSFVLSFTLDTSNIFASALSGDNPAMDWGIMTTQRSLITNHLTLVGWAADILAPDQSYHVATLLFSGLQGDVIMNLDHIGSSLGSRVANGDGPGPIPIDPSPVNITFDIPATLTLDLTIGASRWLQEDSEYALVNGPNGPINILDLVQLINCGAN